MTSIFTLFGYLIFGFAGLAIIVCVGVLLKNENTYKNHMIISNAIHDYAIHCIRNDIEPLVSYEDMESYNVTLNRFYDWGYTRILPKDKFDIIKRYIRR